MGRRRPGASTGGRHISQSAGRPRRQAESPYIYREHFRLGDLVTVRNCRWGVTMDARVTEMKTEYSSSGIRHTVTLGTAPLTVFGRLRRQIKGG